LHKYQEVIQMCEQTLDIAKKNWDNIKDSKCLSDEDLWRGSLMSRSYYRMGKFDISLILFEKYEHVALSETKTKEPSLFSAVIVRELLQIKKVANNIKQSAELLQLKTFVSATRAMEIVTKALSVSCHSEKLLKMKGEALFQLHKYQEVIQMCEQTLDIAKKNWDNIKDSKCLSDEDLWRGSLMSRSYYRMGKFDISLILFEKTKEPSLFSAVIVRELLQIKTYHEIHLFVEAVKRAFMRGRTWAGCGLCWQYPTHTGNVPPLLTSSSQAIDLIIGVEAAKHYTDAIMRSIESRPFTSIFLCNRAAAHQHLGNVIDAIKDCNLAIALDWDHMKAISRRAGLHEKIRDYEHASLDMERLISLQEKRSEKKYVKDLKDSRERLSSLKKNMEKGMSMDLYMILGLKRSESNGSEIKKAYDKAARSPDERKAYKLKLLTEDSWC
nr:hypothetical protein [Tanacetum cinerariifolium]